jgi:DNA-binding XRE family transcriptional regulator
VNKNATFKKVFESIESGISVACSTLPEKTTAEKIYKLRMLNGCTQREFANKCGVGYSSICKYETGWNPSNENLKKICKALNKDISYFSK